MATKKQDWEIALLEKDNSLFGKVNIVADGYNLSYQKNFSKKKSVWFYYVDGTWKWIYSNIENEIGQKFGNPKKSKIPKSLYDLIRESKGKRQADKQKLEYESRIIYYSCVFTSASQIIKILKANCTDIKLISNH